MVCMLDLWRYLPESGTMKIGSSWSPKKLRGSVCQTLQQASALLRSWQSLAALVMVIVFQMAASLQLARSDARKQIQRRPKENQAHYKMVKLPDYCPSLA